MAPPGSETTASAAHGVLVEPQDGSGGARPSLRRIRAWSIALPSRPGRARTVLLALLAVGIVAAGIVAAAATGMTASVVASPSMGRAAPVGTLVITRPVPFAAVRVGDVVTYRIPPTSRTVTHRVVSVDGESLSTRGDINGAIDPLPVTPAMLVGRAEVVAPGVGWLIRLTPWAAVGCLSVWLLTWPLRNAELRAGLRVVGVCAVVTVIVVLQHPLIGWTTLSQTPVGRAMLASIVGTGLLPIRVAAHGGAALTLPPGVPGSLRLPADAAGRVGFDVSLGLEPWGWALLILVCLAPMLAVLVFGLPAEDVEPE